MGRSILVVVVILALGTVLVTGIQSEPVAPTISQQELLRRMDAKGDRLILDVRTPEEFQAGHIPGAVNIPHTVLPHRLDELQPYRDKEVVVYCETGVRAGIAERVLQQAGFAQVRHLQGDMAAWRRALLPQERTPPGH